MEVAETSRRGHATLLARAAADDDFDVVAVLAGDGTLNEAAAGLLYTRTALAPLPGGSTNVYSQTLGYPRQAADAAMRSSSHSASNRCAGSASAWPMTGPFSSAPASDSMRR